MTSSGPSPPKMNRLEEDPPAGGAEPDGDNQASMRKALSELKECQKLVDEVNDNASKEILNVESRYEEMRKPCYDKRAAIIDKIPNFWRTVIFHHPQISVLLTEEEDDCLFYLKKLEVEQFKNVEEGYRIKLVFDENPFFENVKLVKEIQFKPRTVPTGTSTTIKWKEGMDLSKKQPQVINDRKKRGLEEGSTFFSWFSNNSNLAKDYIAAVIKDDLWPSPQNYYPDLAGGDDEVLDESESEKDDITDGGDEDEGNPENNDNFGSGEGEEEEEEDDA